MEPTQRAANGVQGPIAKTDFWAEIQFFWTKKTIHFLIETMF